MTIVGKKTINIIVEKISKLLNDKAKKAFIKPQQEFATDGLIGLAAQKFFTVKKQSIGEFDAISVVNNLNKESLQAVPFKILNDGQEMVFTAFKGTQRGSNIGFFCCNPQDLKIYYVKMGGEQSQSEVFASKLYELLVQMFLK